MADAAASKPLVPAFVPARSTACSIVSVVSTPKITGRSASRVTLEMPLAAYLWVFFSYFRNAYRSVSWPLLALSGGVLAYILQLQTWFTTLSTGVIFWAILGVSVALMRLQKQEKDADVEAGERSSSEEGAIGRQDALSRS